MSNEHKPSLKEEIETLVASETCFCGLWKPKGRAFCGDCYDCIPGAKRAMLSRASGMQFVELVDEIRDELRIEHDR